MLHKWLHTVYNLLLKATYYFNFVSMILYSNILMHSNFNSNDASGRNKLQHSSISILITWGEGNILVIFAYRINIFQQMYGKLKTGHFLDCRNSSTSYVTLRIQPWEAGLCVTFVIDFLSLSIMPLRSTQAVLAIFIVWMYHNIYV